MTFRPNLRPHEIGCLDGSDICSVLLRPRSLLVFSDDMYVDYMHGIEPVLTDVIGENPLCLNLAEAGAAIGDEVQRANRISLTIRRRIS